MIGHDTELDAILEQVEAAGLVEQQADADGKQAMRLTPDGERVARQLAMTGEYGQDALMEALLGESQREAIALFRDRMADFAALFAEEQPEAELREAAGRGS